MTVLSKDGPSTSVARENDNFPDDDDEATYAPEPPSYADAVEGDVRSPTDATTSTATSFPAPTSPSTNFVNVTQSNGAIKGIWVIDTDIEVPAALLSPLPWLQTERPNINLHTNNGSVKATIMLTSRSSEQAFIKANSQNGAIVLKISSRINNQPVKILATTSNGAIKIGLPQGFLGPIKFKTANGKVKYSDAIRASASILSQNTGFIGDWKKSGFVDHTKWSGDSLEVSSSNGELAFFYADEMAEDNAKIGSGGFWRNAAGWFGAH